MNNYFDMNDVEQLIIDKLTGHIGEEDDVKLSALIDQHQEVEHLWQQMQQVYAMRKAVSFEQSFNEEEAWRALQQRVNMPDRVTEPVTDTVAMPERRTTNTWLRYGMAAAVTGIIIIAVRMQPSHLTILRRRSTTSWCIVKISALPEHRRMLTA